MSVLRHLQSLSIVELLREVISQEYSKQVVLGSAVALLLNVSYLAAYRAWRRSCMLHTFLRGPTFTSCSSITSTVQQDRREVIPRETTVAQTRAALCSNTMFFCMTGPVGSGKTSIARKLCRDQGIVYMTIRPDGITEEDFLRDLARAVDFQFDDRISWVQMVVERFLGTTGEEGVENSDWSRVCLAVEATACVARYHLGYTPTLVIDQAGYLDNEVLAKVQDWAHVCAANQWLRIVLILTGGPKFLTIISRASANRMEIIHITGVARQDALDFLLSHMEGLQTEDAVTLVDHYCGTNLLELHKTVDRWKAFEWLPYSDRLQEVHCRMIARAAAHLLRSRTECPQATLDSEVNRKRYYVWKTLLYMLDSGETTMSRRDFDELITADVIQQFAGIPVPFYQGVWNEVTVVPPYPRLVLHYAGEPGSEDRKRFDKTLAELRDSLTDD